MTAGGDPIYWLGSRPKPGAQRDDDLVRVQSENMAAHTLVSAQSGSGKSYFLGRLVEEIILRTRASCVVLDPNADFYRVDGVQPASLWTSARYDQENRLGRLPSEPKRQAFAGPWSQVPKRILTARNPGRERRVLEPLQIWWPDLNIELLGDELDAIRRSQLYHCHAFVRAIWALSAIRRLQYSERGNGHDEPIDIAEKLFGAGDQLRVTIEREFASETMAKTAARRAHSIVDDHVTFDTFWRVMDKKKRLALAAAYIERQTRQALVSAPYVHTDVAKFYFARAREYREKNVLADRPMSARESVRLEVVDLPSIPDRDTRLLMVSTHVADVWRKARTAWAEALEMPTEGDRRVPIFLVVDEAHNVIPAQPRSGAEHSVREQFRTVAAEGRKYGLFLILVSQRPDKLDPLVVSECENKAVMRMDSRSVLESVIAMCGLEDVPPRTLARCLEFGPGRVCLIGRWAPSGPRFAYAAARRTIEGGRNLRVEHWATS
jgi:hypothetical protein